VEAGTEQPREASEHRDRIGCGAAGGDDVAEDGSESGEDIAERAGCSAEQKQRREKYDRRTGCEKADAGRPTDFPEKWARWKLRRASVAQSLNRTRAV
jgi:hypothetical protein